MLLVLKAASEAATAGGTNGGTCCGGLMKEGKRMWVSGEEWMGGVCGKGSEIGGEKCGSWKMLLGLAVWGMVTYEMVSEREESI